MVFRKNYFHHSQLIYYMSIHLFNWRCYDWLSIFLDKSEIIQPISTTFSWSILESRLGFLITFVIWMGTCPIHKTESKNPKHPIRLKVENVKMCANRAINQSINRLYNVLGLFVPAFHPFRLLDHLELRPIRGTTSTIHFYIFYFDNL